MRLFASLVLGLAASTAWAADDDDFEKEYRSRREAKKAAEAGWEMVELQRFPSTERFVVHERRRVSGASPDEAEQHRILLLERQGRRIVTVAEPTPVSGVDRLQSAQLADLVPSSPPELVTMWASDAPDETVVRVQVHEDLQREDDAQWSLRFDRQFLIPRRPPRVDHAYGDVEPKVYVERTEPARLIWQKKPRTLEVKGTGETEAPVRLAIGIEREVYGWKDGTRGLERLSEAGYVDFLPAHPPDEVSATEQMGKIWGTAQAFWATDDDLGTAWSIEPRQVYGGEPSLTIRFREAVPVRMLRIVPGCGATPEAWEERYGLGQARVVLGGVYDFEWTEDGATPAPGVWAHQSFPLGRAFGRQVLTFFRHPRSVGWVRLEWLGHRRPSRRGGEPPEACIAEISVH
ncbi:MAG: hypothetical protein ACFB9M_03390 [Myxococcota bacterium]